MAAAVRAFVARGVPPDDVLVVCGAAHATAITAAYDENRLEAEGRPPAQAQLALIPYSFTRLSEQSGYGAGNRAPWYYEQVWRLRGDYPAASRRAIVAIGQHLRQRGFAASLAQEIDAYSLATTLARLRDKIAPGSDEVADAATACFGQGKTAVVATALHLVLVGEAVGRVTERAGRTPLQAEFYDTVDRLGLPLSDAPRQVLLHLAVSLEAEQSTFLHRLALLDIPYGQELASGLGAGGRVARGTPLEQLARVREKWQLQWTPATDGQLVEKTAFGSRIDEACSRLLIARLARARRVDEGTSVLLEMTLCALAEGWTSTIEQCETLAADSASLPTMARATSQLDGLLSFGAARRLPEERVRALGERLFSRSVLHLLSSVTCGDEAAETLAPSLTSLSELVRRESVLVADPEGFWTAVEDAAGLAGCHPGLRGLALVLLQIAGRLDRTELAERLGYWLAKTADALDNARLVGGLFSLHRGTLVRNHALIGAVTDFLQHLELAELLPLLPTLRRSLGALSAAERAYLTETLGEVLGLAGPEARRGLAVSPRERDWLREIDARVANTLTTWEEWYGIR
jgi:hypothetical protein